MKKALICMVAAVQIRVFFSLTAIWYLINIKLR